MERSEVYLITCEVQWSGKIRGLSDHMWGAMKWKDLRFIWSHVRCNEVDWSQAYLVAFEVQWSGLITGLPDHKQSVRALPNPNQLAKTLHQYKINIALICFGGYFKIVLLSLNICDSPPIFWQYAYAWLCLFLKWVIEKQKVNPESCLDIRKYVTP